jgi:hypothetical protein
MSSARHSKDRTFRDDIEVRSPDEAHYRDPLRPHDLDSRRLLRAQHRRSADGGRKLPKQTFRQRAGSTTVQGFPPSEENAVDDGFAPTANIRPRFPHSVTGCYSCSGEPVQNAG